MSAHLNFAVTMGLLLSDATEYAPGVDKTFATTLSYLAAQWVSTRFVDVEESSPGVDVR